MDAWIDLGSTEQVPEGGHVTRAGVTVFRIDGDWHACASRCPHMGYPMSKGTLRDGVLICAWHNWEFDLQHGGCYRGACDDLPIYPVEIRDDHIWVAGAAAVAPAAETRLREALMAGDMYLQAKAMSQLQQQGVELAAIAGIAMDQAFRHAVSAHQSLRAVEEAQAIVDALCLSESAPSSRRLQVLLQGVRQAGGRSGDRAAVLPLPAPHERAGLLRRLQEYIDDSSPLGIERILLSLAAGSVTEADANEIWEAVFIDVTRPHFLDDRQIFWAAVNAHDIACCLGGRLAPEALAMLAWVAGARRPQLDAETQTAMAWWQEHQTVIDELEPPLADAGSAVDAAELAGLLAGNQVDRPFAWLLQRLQAGASVGAILDACSLLAARRLAALPPNNGGMWGSAIEGVLSCHALRRALSAVPGRYAVPALLHLLYGFFRNRWLPTGQPWSPYPGPVAADAEAYGRAFQAGDAPDLRRQAVALFAADKHAGLEHWLQPLVDEDLSPQQLQLLNAVGSEIFLQAEWQPFISGASVYLMDGRGRQNVRPAARFGRSMLGNEPEESFA